MLKARIKHVRDKNNFMFTAFCSVMKMLYLKDLIHSEISFVDKF